MIRSLYTGCARRHLIRYSQDDNLAHAALRGMRIREVQPRHLSPNQARRRGRADHTHRPPSAKRRTIA